MISTLYTFYLAKLLSKTFYYLVSILLCKYFFCIAGVELVFQAPPDFLQATGEANPVVTNKTREESK